MYMKLSVSLMTEKTLKMIDFTELAKHKIISIESVVFKDNVVKAVLTTTQFNRVTTKPYWFNYKDYTKVIEQMYIGE